MNRQALHFVFWIFLKMHIVKQAGDCDYLVGILFAYSISREIGLDSMKVHFSINFHLKNIVIYGSICYRINAHANVFI